MTFIATVSALYVSIEFIANLLISSKRFKDNSVDAQFVMASARIIAILAGGSVFIEPSEYLGCKLAPGLVWFGIGGLAVALAARPTLGTLSAALPCSRTGRSKWVTTVGLASQVPITRQNNC